MNAARSSHLCHKTGVIEPLKAEQNPGSDYVSYQTNLLSCMSTEFPGDRVA